MEELAVKRQLQKTPQGKGYCQLTMDDRTGGTGKRGGRAARTMDMRSHCMALTALRARLGPAALGSG
eukprot:SAG11_NODE_6545_length_1290_cov_12.962217_1_plen_66_part_10